MHSIARIVGLAVLIVALVTPFSGVSIASAAGELTVEFIAGPYALVDANKPGEEGPMLLTVCATVTNDSGGTCANINVYIGDGTTPGTFAVGSDTLTSLSLQGCATDAHRFIPSLANGDSQVLFWQVAYPPVYDVTYDMTVWAASEDGSCDGSGVHQVTTRSSITAAANKVLGTVTIEPPSGTVSIGNIIEVTATDFNFGLVGSGTGDEQDAWLQPVGNLGFDPCCFRLVSTEVHIASIEPTYSMPAYNLLYFFGIGSTNPLPNYKADDLDYVTYSFIALGDCSTTILPYQEVASGTQHKYSGDYGDEDATITLESDGAAIELSKSVDPLTAEVGNTLTWTVTYTNTSDLPVGDPGSGAALVIIDQGIPDGTEYLTGSAGCSDDCIIYYSDDHGATWDTTEPSPASLVTMIKWYVNEVIPAGEGGTCWFQTEVTDAVGAICNSATAQIDGATVMAETTVCANQPPDVEADKAVALQVEDGVASPGDVLEYTVTITALGEGVATGVVYNDVLDPNVTLVNDSIITSQGLVTSPNNEGDSSVSVDVGDITAGNSATITYEVTVNGTLPAGVTHVDNQGIVTGDNFPSEPTNDPGTPPDDDPTVVLVVSAPDIEVLKTDSLDHDADSNGVPSPGDTIEYEIVVTNSGNQDGLATVLIDAMPAYTSLVIGSVTTTNGTIVEGNTAGDTMVEVNIGTVSGGGGSATVTFQVQIDDVLPADVDTISNQAIVTGDNFPSEPSDDPDTGGPNDPTDTTVTAAPHLEVDKRATPGPDLNSDGFLNPGEVIIYTITIGNSGNQEAASVVFADTPGVNTSLVVPSVATSQGTVTTGNTAGDTDVEVNVGTVQVGVGNQVEISFTVEINDSGAFSQVENQGTARGGNFDPEPSDDPATQAVNDPTVSPVVIEVFEPLIEAYKTDIHVVDADGSGDLSVGDTIEYIITIHNGGTGPASDATFTDTPDANTSLVSGSVTTSLGSVVQGNDPGDTTVEVSIGTIEVDVTVTLGFRVLLKDGDYSLISNQGLVEWGTLALEDEPTDDADTDTGDDPTNSPVYAEEEPPTPPTPAPASSPAVGGDAMWPDKASIIGGLFLLLGALLAVSFSVRRVLSLR